MQMKAYWERWVQKQQRKSVKELIGITAVTGSGVYRKNPEEELVVFLLEPDNLSVLSKASLKRKVYGLMTVLKGLTDLELCCVNSKENFTDNKRYLKKRMAEEKNPKVQKLLQHDLEFLEQMEQRNTGAREFLLLLRLKKENTRELANVLSRVEKAFREQDILVKRAAKEDMKRILSVYFAQQMAGTFLEDYDGERWVIPDEETKTTQANDGSIGSR